MRRMKKLLLSPSFVDNPMNANEIWSVGGLFLDNTSIPSSVITATTTTTTTTTRTPSGLTPPMVGVRSSRIKAAGELFLCLSLSSAKGKTKCVVNAAKSTCKKAGKRAANVELPNTSKHLLAGAAAAMVSRHFLNKLPAFKFQHSFKFSTTASSNFSIAKSSKEPVNHISQCFLNHKDPEISRFFQKGFSQITKKAVGKAIHAVCLKGWTHLSIFHTNTLINMYSKFGNIYAAKYVFDKMPDRNEASWNNIISGYVNSGLYVDACELFREMCSQGRQLNGYVLASLLTAFSRSNCMFLNGIQLHSLILRGGLSCDVFVGTSLLHFYGGYGLLFDAWMLFEEMPHRNVVSWTSLMVNFSNGGLFSEVIDLYQRMRREGVSCNHNTFTTVIRSSGALDEEFLVSQIIGHIIKAGFDNNVSVANSLISIFGSFRKLEHASFVFELMEEHDTISWNSLIAAFAHNCFSEESLRYFHLMRTYHGEVDKTTLSTIVSVCHTVDDLKWGRRIHGLVLKMGLEPDVCISNSLLTMYFETGKKQDAEKLFHSMPEKDLISWNSLVAGYASGGEYFHALSVVCAMRRRMKIVNFVTYASVLSACGDAELVAEGMIVHALVIVSGLHENLVVGNALVTMYGKCGLMDKAREVFQNMPAKELVTWNALVGGYANNEEVDEALKTFKLMRQNGISPNYITLINILGSFSDPCSHLKHGKALHAHIVLIGFDSDEYVRNSLISMYANSGDLDSSNNIFNALVDRTSATWNAMVSAEAHCGQWEEALKLILEMQRAEIDFNEFNLSAALAASANLAILEDGQHFHGLAVKLGFDSYHFVANAAMDMYGKCGELDDLLKLLPAPDRRSILSWNVLISALARHGYFRKALETFHEMLSHGAKPSHVTFVSLLSACSHGGLVDKGLEYFTSMTTKFGIPAAIEHCVCIVDLLGRSGRLDEAEQFIKDMPVAPNDFVWRSLLAACKIHRHLELGRKVVERLLEANPSDDSAFVLYSNVCATSGRWQEVQGLRSKMETENVKKKPACSWLNVKGKVITFGAGDQSHLESVQIYHKLSELRKKIKEAGYVPDTSYALHDTDEEQKEDNLWKHSERLALAYGLISTCEGSTIRIFKNLRVCGDCHSVYKFVSGIVCREIILRDPYRFHHFNSGECSCGDYW